METIPPDDCSECSRYRGTLDSWLEEPEPDTITTSIEALRSTQDKAAETLERICNNIEAACEDP